MGVLREKCLFCEMASGERETEFVYEDESVFVIRDIAPQAPEIGRASCRERV